MNNWFFVTILVIGVMNYEKDLKKTPIYVFRMKTEKER